MVDDLIIEELTEKGSSEIGRFKASKIQVGREVDSDLRIAVDGVSRSHGLLVASHSHWLFTDTGSTNGSWVSGDRIFPGYWRVLRSGDLIQLATAVLRVKEGSGIPTDKEDRPTPKIIVISEEAVVDEFPIPESGTVLTIGGPESDLDQPSSSETSGAITVKAEGRRLTIHRSENSLPVTVNAEHVGESSTLANNDQIVIGVFTLIVFLPLPVTAGSAARPPLSTGEFQAIRKGLAFGQAHSDEDKTSEIGGTMMIDPSHLEQLRQGYRRRGAAVPDEDEAEKFAIIEDSLIMILGIGLLGALVGILIWWLFRG